MTKVAIAAVLFAAAAGVAGGATSGQPSLRVSVAAPLVVLGTDFRGHEQVVVSYRADRTWTRRETATPAGTFTVRFDGVRFQPCKTHRLAAVGSNGSKAFFKMPAVTCPPSPNEP